MWFARSHTQFVLHFLRLMLEAAQRRYIPPFSMHSAFVAGEAGWGTRVFHGLRWRFRGCDLQLGFRRSCFAVRRRGCGRLLRTVSKAPYLGSLTASVAPRMKLVLQQKGLLSSGDLLRECDWSTSGGSRITSCGRTSPCEVGFAAHSGHGDSFVAYLPSGH